MWIEKLALHDFRNYADEEASLGPGLNVIVGRNAQGKTNLLEAIHCLSGLGSPRGPDVAVIRQGAEAAVLHANLHRGDRAVAVDLEIKSGRGSRALVNKSALRRVRALSEVVVSVFFGPDELSLIKGSPEGRRRWLDDLVVKLRPAREGLRREWERVLRQRNALLKDARATRHRTTSGSLDDSLAVWDEALARTGAALTAARLEALAALRPYASKRFEEVAGGGRIELTYESTWGAGDAGATESDLRAQLQAKLHEVRVQEIERAVSLAGPHRDDVAVSLTSSSNVPMLDARSFGSQGEQRTGALALKLGEHDLLTEVLGDQPILLLDDVLSELDPQRRRWLADAVRGNDQTILTSAELEHPGVLEPDRVFEIVAGRVRTA